MSKQTIWTNLKARGFSDNAIAAIMGNMEAESNCVSCRLQGDFSKGFSLSATYARKVDTGEISKNEFTNHGPNGGGFGLCQWTYPSRKSGLYECVKSRAASIGDEEAQLEWLWQELHQAEYASTLETLLSDCGLKDKVSVFMKKFERPQDQSEAAVQSRCLRAQNILNEFSATEAAPVAEAPEVPAITTEPESKEPESVNLIDKIKQALKTQTGKTCRPTCRVLKRRDKGRDVGMLQWALVDAGFDLGEWGPNKDGIDGYYGQKTEDAVNYLKGQLGITQDGICDLAVWNLIFQ